MDRGSRCPPTVINHSVGKEIKFEQNEGVVQIRRKVKVKVAAPHSSPDRGRARELTTTKIDTLSAGSNEKSYQLDYIDEEVEEFQTYAQAEQHFRQQLRRGGGTNADDLATLGFLYLEEGKPGEAYKYFNQALEINRQLFPGGIAPILAENYTELGYANLELDKPERAIGYFREALQIEKQIDPEDPFIASSYANLADALIQAGEEQTAHDYLDKAIEILEFNLDIDQEDYTDAQEVGDADLAWQIALDISDNYEERSFACELAQDAQCAEESSRLAEVYRKRADAL